MNEMNILLLESPAATLELTGGKGASLSRLANAGLPVPGGFHITTLAYRRFVAENGLMPHILAALQVVQPARPETLEEASRSIREMFLKAHIPDELAAEITQAYHALAGEQAAVAVRSSATAEDLPDASFAGQQETYLNVSGAVQVLEAVRKCWASLWTGRAIGYRARQGIHAESVALAVVVQLLVPAEAAGILFTANPLNGRRDQLLVNAAWGLGEAVVGGLVTPDTLVVEKDSLNLVESQVVDKQVMTVRTENGTEEQEVPQTLRKAPVLDVGAAVELCRMALRIEELYGMPMDIEWARMGSAFSILQARPITALPEPEAPLPQEWKVPNRRAKYMRNNIVELIPDPMPPFFETFGRRAINAAMRRVVGSVPGMEDIMPHELLISINGYAYYNGDFSTAQIFKLLWRSPRIMKVMFTGIEGRYRAAQENYRAVLASMQAKPWRQSSTSEILQFASQLMEAAVEFYGQLVAGQIPAAWMSEAAFTKMYNLFMRRKGDPEASIYLLGFESLPIQGEKALFDLAMWARSQPELAEYLKNTPAASLVEQCREATGPQGVDESVWNEWQDKFHTHLDEFGGMIYDLDFTKPTPADDPVALMEACKLFVQGGGSNPHLRQQAAAHRREEAVQAMQARLKGFRLKSFRKNMARAQKYAPLRESGLAELGLGYPLLRRMLLEVGGRLCRAGTIETGEDIFWLTSDEVQQAAALLERGEKSTPMGEPIRWRKAVERARRRVTPPYALPQSKVYEWFGINKPAKESGNVLKGVGCSTGRITGRARVIHSPNDFSQMKAGEILVAGITTPAWTPLFALASAVVTDVGGPLSHGSIVAREYGIPAVLGTGSATRRITSGQMVTVDGSAGRVTLEAISSPAEKTDIDWKLPDPKGIFMRASVVDLLPTPLSPLFITAGIRALTDQITQLGLRLTKMKPVLQDYYYTSINSYAYMNARMPFKTWVWVIFCLFPSMPRIMSMAIPFWRDEAHPRYQQVVAQFRGQKYDQKTAAGLWKDALYLIDEAAYYICTLMFATMGASAGSEASLTTAYNKLVKKEGDPPATTMLMGWNNIPVRSEKSLYDLAQWCLARPELAETVKKMPSEELISRIRSGDFSGLPRDFGEFSERFKTHLEKFGYIIFQLDFASQLPLDCPEPMLETIKMYLNGQGSNPYQRQQESQARREQTTAMALSRVKGLKGWIFRKALGWGQTMAEVREDALAEIGLGYPVLRAILYELGNRFVQANAIRQAEDIFWLEKEEIGRFVADLETGKPLEDAGERVRERRANCEKMKKISPPPILPPRKRYMGVKTSTWVAESEDSQQSNVLKGVPTSAGRVTAPASVLRGPEDFNLMQPGNVLVAGTTTPAWTPLFAMASAVVTDIGGPLSHGSIVAREYGIPAVMGTGIATRRIRSGQLITVDGTSGLVELHS